MRIRELRALEGQALASMSEPRSGELRSCLPRKYERERTVSLIRMPSPRFQFCFVCKYSSKFISVLSVPTPA